MERPSKLRQVREARGLTVRQVAAAVGTTHATLSRIECGDRRPSIELARSLLEYYDGEISLGEIHDVAYRPEADVLEHA